MLRSTLCISRTKCGAVLDSSQGNNASWKLVKEIVRQNVLRRARIRKCLDQISHSDTPKLSSLRLSLILENEGHASLPLKVFRIESRDAIPLRGGGL